MKKLYEETHIQDIATAIREKNGATDTYKLSEMAEAIANIEVGGSGESGGLTLLYTAEITEPVNQINLNLDESSFDEYDFIYIEPDNVIPSTTEWLCTSICGSGVFYIGSGGGVGRQSWGKKDFTLIMQKTDNIWYITTLGLSPTVVPFKTQIITLRTYYTNQNTFNSGTIRLYGGKW